MSGPTDSEPIHYAEPAAHPRTGAPRWLRRTFVGLIVLLAFVAGVLTSDAVRAWLRHDHYAGSAATDGAAKQLWTCGMHPQVIQDHPGKCPICHMDLTPLSTRSAPASRSGRPGGAEVWIDPVVVQNMGVRVVRVERGPLRQDIRVVGYLREPDSAQHDVSLRVSGWVEKLYVDSEGVEVNKGQPLFDLYSPELQVAIYELITSRQTTSRAGGNDVDRRTADALFNAARQKLLQWGLGPKQVEELATLDKAPATIAFLSPINGHVTEKNVVQGSAVQAGQRVLRLADRSRMWLDAQVHERQLPSVKPGQKVTATVVALPGRTFEGEVAFVHPHLDPTTRTALVRVSVPNADHALRQGMYATVDVSADAVPDAVLAPREAVIDSGTRQLVFLALGEGHFEPREVKLGPAGAGGVVQVLEGLSPGDQAVVSGQFLLDSESRLKEAVEKHLAVHGAAVQKGHARLPAPPLPATAPVTARANVTTDALAAAYLQVWRQLAAPADDATAPPVPVEPLVVAAGGLKDVTPSLAASARAMAEKPRSEQRRLFKPLSEAIVAVLAQHPTSPAVADKLFVLHCPMAFNGAGADWVQSTDAVANPYYASAMKSCGTVTRELAPADGGR